MSTARAYKRRASICLFAALASLVAATLIAWVVSGAHIATAVTVAVLYSSLTAVAFGLAAIVSNDLRRNANRGFR